MSLQVIVERTCANCGRPVYWISGELTHDSGIDAVLRSALCTQDQHLAEQE